MFGQIIEYAFKNNSLKIIWLSFIPIAGFILSFDEKSLLIMWFDDIKTIALVKMLLLSSIMAITLILTIIVIRRMLSNKVDPDKFEKYHPNVGVTVYRAPENSRFFDSNVWYCANCLTADHVLSHLQAANKPAVSGYEGWKCFKCQNVINP